MAKDYSFAKIYTIQNRNSPDDVYVGSTTQTYLCQRWASHLQSFREGRKTFLYQRMRDTDVSDWYIELYEAYPCSSIDELLKREGEIIRQIATLNKNIAGRTDKEYYIDNKDILVEKKKNYYKNNRERRLAYQNDYNRKKRENLHNEEIIN